MLYSRLMISTMSLAVIAACTTKYAEVPTPTNFENSEQKVLQAANHWNLINKKVSEDLLSSIHGKVSTSDRILLKPENSLYSQQLYIDTVKTLSAAGYRVVKYDFLNSRGIYDFKREKSLPTHDVAIELKTNVVRFTRERKEPVLSGGLTALAAGLWFLKVWDTTNWGRATGAIAATDTAGYFYHDKYFSDGAPQSEIIIDVIVSRNDEYVSVNKDIFYVISSDATLYKAVKSKEPFMKEYAIKGANS